MSKILIDKALLAAVLGALEDLHRTGDTQVFDLYAAPELLPALREALAEQPAQQDSTCSNTLRIQGKAYPRTCKKCGLGPCIALAQQALDKMAENARALGLDYEPPQRTWVGLTVEEKNEITWGKTIYEILVLFEAKLKEKNHA